MIQFGQVDISKPVLTVAGDLFLQGDESLFGIFQAIRLPCVFAVDLERNCCDADLELEFIPLAGLCKALAFGSFQVADVALHVLTKVDLVAVGPGAVLRHGIVAEIDAAVPLIVTKGLPFELQNEIAVLFGGLYQSFYVFSRLLVFTTIPIVIVGMGWLLFGYTLKNFAYTVIRPIFLYSGTVNG